MRKYTYEPHEHNRLDAKMQNVVDAFKLDHLSISKIEDVDDCNIPFRYRVVLTKRLNFLSAEVGRQVSKVGFNIVGFYIISDDESYIFIEEREN